MGRISRQIMFMEMARVASRRSTCFRLNVGALATYYDNPVSIGWNGAEAGAPHCAGNNCPGVIPGACNTVHAEINALKKAADLIEHGEGIDLYLTHSPCQECLYNIMRGPLQIKRLFFETLYRKSDHLNKLMHKYEGPQGPDFMVLGDGELMRKTEVFEVTPAGYIVEYFSRQVVELP